MTIREFFNTLYAAATTDEAFDAVMEYEIEVYEMEEGFEEWACERNIDLFATQVVLGQPTLVTQLWAWDMEE